LPIVTLFDFELGFLPPLALNFTVYFLPDQCAYKVLSADPILDVDVTFAPPDRAVNQPLNVYPARDGVGNEPRVAPANADRDPGDTEPPFASNRNRRYGLETVTGDVAIIPLDTPEAINVYTPATVEDGTSK